MSASVKAKLEKFKCTYESAVNKEPDLVKKKDWFNFNRSSDEIRIVWSQRRSTFEDGDDATISKAN